MFYIENIKGLAMKRTPVHLRRASRRLGEDFQTWRKIQGLTVEDVARRAAVSRGTIYRLEKGDLGVSIGTILAVASAVGQLELIAGSMDPMKTDVGQLRLREKLPERVRR